jgi:hypothetical protein
MMNRCRQIQGVVAALGAIVMNLVMMLGLVAFQSELVPLIWGVLIWAVLIWAVLIWGVVVGLLRTIILRMRWMMCLVRAVVLMMRLVVAVPLQNPRQLRLRITLSSVQWSRFRRRSLGVQRSRELRIQN